MLTLGRDSSLQQPSICVQTPEEKEMQKIVDELVGEERKNVLTCKKLFDMWNAKTAASFEAFLLHRNIFDEVANEMDKMEKEGEESSKMLREVFLKTARKQLSFVWTERVSTLKELIDGLKREAVGVIFDEQRFPVSLDFHNPGTDSWHRITGASPLTADSELGHLGGEFIVFNVV